MMEWIDMIPLVGMLAAFSAGACFGGILGSRSEAAYWADHVKDGGCVHHKGQFYNVVTESEYNLLNRIKSARAAMGRSSP